VKDHITVLLIYEPTTQNHDQGIERLKLLDTVNTAGWK